MNIAFRTDASLDIGTGHVMRCLTLATYLRDSGAKCHFICRDHVGNLIEMIRGHGFLVQILASPIKGNLALADKPIAVDQKLEQASWLGVEWDIDAMQTMSSLAGIMLDILVVDHYALDVRWEAELKPYVGNLMVIDDLANREHACDLLLDQNLGRDPIDYANLVPAECKVLIGPQYALLRAEFSEIRQYSLKRREGSPLKRLIISLGGVDRANSTGALLSALTNCELPQDCRITVIMGPHATWIDQVRKLAAKMRWQTEVLVDVVDIASRMAESDLAIGAAGVTAWERCSLGLPSIVIPIATNQISGAVALEEAGCAVMIKSPEDIYAELCPSLLLMAKDNNLFKMQKNCAAIANGNGAINVTAILMS